MRWRLVAVAMLGCGGGTKKDPDTPACLDCGLGPGGMNGDGAAQEAAVRKHLCERAAAHASAGCAPFDRMDPRLLETCSVVTSFQLAGMDHCLVEASCDLMSACFDKARAADYPRPYSGPTRACTLPDDHDDLGYPAGLAQDELASYGRDARTYADAPSTKDQPIEVCGFPAAAAWLSRMTCKDGSRPLPTRRDAERMRVGNVGKGGRCGRIVDQYQVECPEMTYDIFIDAYRCQR